MGRKKLLGVVALLLCLLSISLAFGSGLVNVARLQFFNSSKTVTSTSSPTVFMEPVKIIKDYLLDPGYQIGSKFTVHVNVSGVSDLFSWQINLTWDKAILNVSRLIPNEFLARSINLTSSEVLGFVINSTDNAQGNSGFAETILGDVAGIPGPSSGRLVSIEFLVVGYGCTDITISLSGTLPTTLLNSTGGIIALEAGNVQHGYFRNKLQGDANGDKTVDSADISVIIYYRSGPPPGPGGYDRNADIDDNGFIDSADISLVIANRGRSVPP